jgi:hypothetical protein
VEHGKLQVMKKVVVFNGNREKDDFVMIGGSLWVMSQHFVCGEMLHVEMCDLPTDLYVSRGWHRFTVIKFCSSFNNHPHHLFLLPF